MQMKLIGRCMEQCAEKKFSERIPIRCSYFNLIYEAKLPRTLFTVNVKTGELVKLFSGQRMAKPCAVFQYRSKAADVLP
jgi:hypothetical protein